MDSPDRSRLDELFRSFHSIKGLSAMVGLSAAEQVAHRLESRLGAIRHGTARLDHRGVEELSKGVERLEHAIGSYREHHRGGAERPAPVEPADYAEPDEPSTTEAPPPPSGRPAPSLAELTDDQRAQVTAAAERGESAWWVTFNPSPALAERGLNVNRVREILKSAGELVFAAPHVRQGGQIAFDFLVLVRSGDGGLALLDAEGLERVAVQLPDRMANAPVSAISTALGQVPPAASVVRVGLERLDDLMRMVGELVNTRARLEENLDCLGRELPSNRLRELEENNSALERQIRDLREGIMRARLVPIRDAFTRMRFVLRDLAREGRTQIELHMAGEETEVDKLIVQRMLDPLLHLVRNAASHGIEPAADRIAAGKPAAGRVELRARSDGQIVSLEVEDDGRGIDAAAVHARAAQLGLVTRVDPTSSNLLDLLCLPGFSTRATIDRASGRGVGMDVVRRTVEELGGSLNLWTEAGRGTRFTMKLPLTLSIADALVFEVAGQTFALPQSFVLEVIQFEPGGVARFQASEIIEHRGSALPLARLAEVFALPLPASPPRHALIVEQSAGEIGLVVDRLLGIREIVIHPLADPLVRVTGIAGATELGNGRVALILDAAGIARRAEAGAAGMRHGFLSSPLGIAP